MPETIKVVIKRKNGRLLKEIPARSSYHAKLIARSLRSKYDESFTITVVK